jgi:hypothetical protein
VSTNSANKAQQLNEYQISNYSHVFSTATTGYIEDAYSNDDDDDHDDSEDVGNENYDHDDANSSSNSRRMRRRRGRRRGGRGVQIVFLKVLSQQPSRQ